MTTKLRYVDCYKDMDALMLGSYYDDDRDEIVISKNHPIFHNQERMLRHEIGHMMFHRKFKGEWFVNRLTHEIYAFGFAIALKRELNGKPLYIGKYNIERIE
jgi:hypothetical protein